MTEWQWVKAELPVEAAHDAGIRLRNQIPRAPDPCGKWELCVQGPNVTSGNYSDAPAIESASDEDDYYRAGDTDLFLKRDDRNARLILGGRIVDS